MPKVTFKSTNEVFHLTQNGSLVDLDNEDQTELLFGCRAAACGTCAIKVIEGIENLNQKTECEEDFLDLLGINNAEHRLACQCKIHGDVTILSLD